MQELTILGRYKTNLNGKKKVQGLIKQDLSLLEIICGHTNMVQFYILHETFAAHCCVIMYLSIRCCSHSVNHYVPYYKVAGKITLNRGTMEESDSKTDARDSDLSSAIQKI